MKILITLLGFINGCYMLADGIFVMLKGKEKNYIFSKFYLNGALTERRDTILPDCMTALNDSLFY